MIKNLINNLIKNQLYLSKKSKFNMKISWIGKSIKIKKKRI